MMYIYASAAFHQAIDNELPNLKDEVKRSCGRHVRRIDRFIQLAMIGSHRCMDGQHIAPASSLYLASSGGSKTNTVAALDQVFIEKQPIMPLNFVNLVSNAAAFYVAQSLQIDGVSLFVSSTASALEKALHLAALDLADNTSTQALVGSVDECAAPIALQRQLLNAGSQPLGESSYWFLTGSQPEGAIGCIHDNHAASWDDAWPWLQQHANTDSCIAIGSGLNEAQQQQLASLPGTLQAYTRDMPVQEGLSGHALHHFLQQDHHSQLLHIECSDEGQCRLLRLLRQ